MQLAQRLARAIRSGRFQADEALPSERMLSESLALSCVTARKATEQLVDQALVERRRGSGNYIACVGYQKSGQPMELTHSYCRSDYYGFVAEMRKAA